MKNRIPKKYNSESIAALFDGQGVTHTGMGKETYKRFAASREVFSESSAKVGVDLARVCFGDLAYLQESPRIVQPATVAVDLAEYAAWRELNDGDAEVVTGLSLGMFAALGAARVFNTYADAVEASARRAQIMHEAYTENPGHMAGVVGLALHELEPIVRKAGAGIAVIRDRARHSFVVTGGDKEVDDAEKEARKNGVRRWERLKFKGFFHHEIHEESKDPLRVELDSFKLNNPHISLLGNNALYLMSAQESVEHVLDQLTETSDWDSVIELLNNEGIRRVVETGPDESRGLARQMNKRFKTEHIKFP